MSNAVDRILSGTAEQAEARTAYRALDESGARPQMGFSVTHATGDVDGFLYHALDNIKYQTRRGQEFLSFAHQAKAVTMQGKGLRAMFRAIIRHTAMECTSKTAAPPRPASRSLPGLR
jgi:hypothetical protein